MSFETRCKGQQSSHWINLARAPRAETRWHQGRKADGSSLLGGISSFQAPHLFWDASNVWAVGTTNQRWLAPILPWLAPSIGVDHSDLST